MSKNAIVPKVKVNVLAKRKTNFKDMHLVEGKKDVYFVIYEDLSKELVYTYEESSIIPKGGITKIDFSEFRDCLKIIVINGIDYAICTKLNGMVFVIKLPGKEIIFELNGDTSLSLKRIDERYIEIFSISMNESKVYDTEENKICFSMPSDYLIYRKGDYFLVRNLNGYGIVINDNGEKIFESDEDFYINNNKLIMNRMGTESIRIYDDLSDLNTYRDFSKQDWHIHKPIYIDRRGEIITLEKGQIIIYDLDFKRTALVKIPKLNDNVPKLDYDGYSLFLYWENNTIFYNFEREEYIEYSEIWRFPFDNPSAFIGINTDEKQEDKQVYHIHNKKFEEVISIYVDVDNTPSEPISDNEAGCIFAIKNIEKKWVLINTITGEYIEKDEYIAFKEGIDCICGVRATKEGKVQYVIDVYDFNFVQKVSNFDCEKYGLYIMGRCGRLPIQLIGNVIYFKGNYDIGTLQDLEPEYIFGSDGQKIFGFDRGQTANENERIVQSTMRDSKIFLREIRGQKFLKIVSPQNNELWLNPENGEFCILNGR